MLTHRILHRLRLSSIYHCKKHHFLQSSPISTQRDTFNKYPFLAQLGLHEEHNSGVWNGNWASTGPVVLSKNPATAEPIASVITASASDYEAAVHSMHEAKLSWQRTPMPSRASLLRSLSAALTQHLPALASLITLETGKILSEAKGEVQEAIDICDYAAGLGRSIDGHLFPSERQDHLIMERWLPLNGHVAVITAFNFPVAVLFWNLALSLLLGNSNIWKPSPSTPLISIACMHIITQTLSSHGYDPRLVTLVCGDTDIGRTISEDPRIALLSFTGSTRIGAIVSKTVAARLGRSLLELGGNNGMIVMDDADLHAAVTAAVFAAIGTSGQRCTTLRRLYIHQSIYDEFIAALLTAYKSVKIGDPMSETTLMGPLHSQAAVDNYTQGIIHAQKQGGKILYGGHTLPHIGTGHYVEPTIVSISSDAACVQHELFAPVLYVMKVSNLDEAIKLHNNVPQGLSSSIFTRSLAHIGRWISSEGSDCGLVNVNVGTSGAEIGGAFGGEKQTGGGRESGSDAWKTYGRRATCVINYGQEQKLAQGIKFEVNKKQEFKK